MLKRENKEPGRLGHFQPERDLGNNRIPEEKQNPSSVDGWSSFFITEGRLPAGESVSLTNSEMSWKLLHRKPTVSK